MRSRSRSVSGAVLAVSFAWGALALASPAAAAVSCTGVAAWTDCCGCSYAKDQQVTFGSPSSRYHAAQSFTNSCGAGWTPSAVASLWTLDGACGAAATPTMRPTASVRPRPTSTPSPTVRPVRPTGARATPSARPTSTPTPTAIATATTPPRPTAAYAWHAGVRYPVGAMVTYGPGTYRAMQGHESQAGFEPPNVPALWQLVSGGYGSPQPSPRPRPYIDVALSATVATIGQTFDVTSSGNVKNGQWTLRVIDNNTGLPQSSTNPIVTFELPASRANAYTTTPWVLKAARTGAVRFEVTVTGEGESNCVGCFAPATVSAASSVVNVTSVDISQPYGYVSVFAPSRAAAGDTYVVTGTSNISAPTWTLTVVDTSTGQAQSDANPILSPTTPTFAASPGSRNWSLRVVRSGSVRFVIDVEGYANDSACPNFNCPTFTRQKATSVVTTLP